MNPPAARLAAEPPRKGFPRPRAVIVLLCVLSLLAAACGGSDQLDSTADTSRPGGDLADDDGPADPFGTTAPNTTDRTGSGDTGSGDTGPGDTGSDASNSTGSDGPTTPSAASTNPPPTVVDPTSPIRPPGSSAASGPVPSGAPVDPISWAPCGARECAQMAVPLDHNDPGGPSIELTLGRLRAGDPSRRIGALLVNPGGPGASGLELLDRIGAGAEVRARFDIVAWDPRGVGQSTPVTCGGAMSGLRLVDSSPDTPDEQAALDAAATQAAQACGASSGNLLAHVATLDTVDDMDLIRRGLGEEQISYLGFSYGTSLGQLYLDRYPDHLRALAIDGVVDPSVGFESWLESQTRGFDAAMNQVFASCTNSCPNGDAAAAYDELRRQVEVAPLPGSSGLTLGPTELATAAIMTGYSSNLWPSFISGLDRGLSGDGSGLTELAARYWRLVDFDAYTSVVCLDGAHPTNGPDYAAFADRLGAVSPRFGEAIANELSPCASWPAAPRATPGIITGTGSPPVLVVGTTGDPATPYADAVRVAGQLENGVLLTHRGDRHIAYGRSGCATQIVDTYLLSLEVPPEGSTC